MKNVKEIFDQIDPTGKKGINYIQFKAVLVDVLQMEFDDDDPEDNSIDEICNTLDPNGTGFIQYDRLYKQWTEQAEDGDGEVDLDE